MQNKVKIKNVSNFHFYFLYHILVDLLPSLRTGEGIFLGEVMPIPSRVRIRKAKRKPVGDDPNLPDVWQKGERPDQEHYKTALLNWRSQSTLNQMEENGDENNA